MQTTSTANKIVCKLTVSFIKNADASRVTKGCISCVWLTRAIPPKARPLFQRKKPNSWLTKAKYKKLKRTFSGRLLKFSSGACIHAGKTINGNEITSAQQITCQPPNSFESFPPSAYPIPALKIAPSSSKSPNWKEPKPCKREYETTTILPIRLKIQKPIEGFSLETITAAVVVANGKTPSTTPPCDAGTVSIAHAVKTGNPKTTPNATTESCINWCLFGLDCFVAIKINAATTEAITARPNPMNIGSK